jgi:hypothetical protein
MPYATAIRSFSDMLLIVTSPGLGVTLPKGFGMRPGLEDVRVSPVVFCRTEATSNDGSRAEFDDACDAERAELNMRKHDIDDIQAIDFIGRLLGHWNGTL